MDVNTHNTHIVHGFEYHAPATVAEACRLLADNEAIVLAGGTDVIVRMKDGSLRPRHVVNIKKIPGLAGIKETSDGVWIGALTRIRDVEKSGLIQEKLPVLYKAACTIGSVQVRNLATVAGNVCNASPAADSSVALLALDAKVHVAGSAGERVIPIEAFFTGPGETVLAKGEIVTGFTVPEPAAGTRGAWLRVARASMDIATISLAATAKLSGGVVEASSFAWGTVGPTPLRTRAVEDYLKGKRLDAATVEEAAKLAAKSIRPRESGRSSGVYKRRVAQGFVREALEGFAKE